MICVFLLFVISLLSFQPVIAQSTLQTYIVHVNLPADQVPGESQDLETWYRSFLPEVTANSEEPSRIRHAYRNVITGFAAKLSPEEVKEMEKKEGFLHARPERMYALKTTHSPNFLGLYQNLGSWPESNYGKGVIIGVFDTGITPGHPSFDDEGVPPPPARWKGKCELKGTACNNKLIGARNFAGDDPGPPIDHDGHGTHTASTAAGNFVSGANLFGQANGVASGMSPLAHLAIYKVCSEDGCFESDSMAAFDAAIEDGVDLLSISIGGISVSFYEDGIALGAFAAMENGILVVLCLRGGNVARIAKGQAVKDAGGAAMILMNDKPDAYDTLADPHVLPAAHVSYADGVKIRAYINSTSNPKATILFKGTVIGDKTAPTVASYSSRGPSRASPLILKPDIIGPGSSILAAWPIPVYNNTNVKATFNMISGTSMSCPHLSGIAGLIKSVHPDWSPAMIKSAIMTSATQTNLNNSLILDQRHLPADIFAMGAGHVNPSRALDPGLVYDIKTRDYISYLCYMYTENQVAIIVNRKINCGRSVYKGVPGPQLNYPSFAIQLGHRSQTYPRTVTNVGDAKSSYYVQIENVPGVDVTVEPNVLAFTTVNQKKTYTVSFSRQDFTANGSYVQGSIAWISAKHIVRIPISVNLVL
ncbi:UNVERIFIED_CONTAM: Subtilisin-like protease SBT1.2 [Sesamum angustifolium]|uniref:Subtilisin-like protease SBT1.2 n=1 Tax=Sesamum angustifolium TaxID=2727405 RepID=A0AAW2J2D3_9LAMI